MTFEEVEKIEKDVLISRIVELEGAIKWLVNERLSAYADGQYGKGNMRKILKNGSLPVIGE